MSNDLKTAIEAAKVGAEVGLKYFNSPLKVTFKHDGSIVTAADKEAEEAIKNCITKQIPSAEFVGEETGGDITKKEFWIIDPIDGTRSFTRGIDSWCVLISHYKNGLVDIGVCYFPVLHTLIYAELGKGAFCDEKPIRVSMVTKLEESYLGFGSIRHFKNKKPLLKLLDMAGSARSPESTYIAYLVACGKMDILVDAYGQVWDIAPFKVIIEEAGGKLTPPDGTKWTLQTRGCVATNGFLHDQVIDIMNS